jgi:hypothetical protein
MDNYAINSGSFSKAGNFTAYTAIGEKIFIGKAQMAGLNLEEGAMPTFPFYIIGANKTINPYDAEGKPQLNADGTLVETQRLSALSVFATKDAITAAHVDTACLNIEIKAAISTRATAAGLNEQAIASLLELA